MLCEKCVHDFVLPRLREDDIAVLQYLYNENIKLPQLAQHKYAISSAVNISPFRGGMALFRLECYDLVKLQTWSKSHNYYLSEEGIKALTTLSQKIGG
jgi:hypothetical protein